MSAFKYRCALLKGRCAVAASSERVALPANFPSELNKDAPIATARTDWRRPSLCPVLADRDCAGALTRGNGASTFAETDRCEARPMRTGFDDDLIAVEQKGAPFAVGQENGLGTSFAELQQAAASVACVRDGARAEQVARAQVAASARVMREHLSGSPVQVPGIGGGDAQRLPAAAPHAVGPDAHFQIEIDR